jgi:hypothetical protein
VGADSTNYITSDTGLIQPSNNSAMSDATRLIRDATGRFKLKVSLPGGRYQLSLDDRAVILLTDELGYAERDPIPTPVVPLLVAMGDAWFPRERDVDRIIQDLPSDGHLPESERPAVRSYLTSNYVQERNVTRVLDAVERSPLRSLAEDDLTIKSLPSIPDSLEPGTTATSTQTASTGSTDSTTTQPTLEEPEGEETDPAVFEDIPGIGPKRSRQLAQTGHSSLEELAESRPADLAATSGISEGIAAVAIEGARELVGKVPPTEERLAAQTGSAASIFDKTLSSLAASGVPPSEAEPSLRTIYGPTVGDIETVSGAQAYFLWEAGYRTPRDIVEASQQEIEAVYDVGSATAHRIQAAARELLDSFG